MALSIDKVEFIPSPRYFAEDGQQARLSQRRRAQVISTSFDGNYTCRPSSCKTCLSNKLTMISDEPLHSPAQSLPCRRGFQKLHADAEALAHHPARLEPNDPGSGVVVRQPSIRSRHPAGSPHRGAQAVGSCGEEGRIVLKAVASSINQLSLNAVQTLSVAVTRSSRRF